MDSGSWGGVEGGSFSCSEGKTGERGIGLEFDSDAMYILRPISPLTGERNHFFSRGKI